MPESPRIVVFTTLFPNAAQPGAGVFIRERMFRVARVLPLMVVAPVPWFPFQGLIRLFRPHFRPAPSYREIQDGIEVLHPRFFSIPGIFKSLDGLFLALSTFALMRKLQREQRCEIIDSHFAYPDGYAASLLGRWLALPFTVTLRGTESRLAKQPAFRKRMTLAMQSAARVFSVSDSLRQLALALGIPEARTQVVGNGVDTTKFHAVDKIAARIELGLPPDAPVLISVGGLVERKGFHRVIACLPALLENHPELHYLIVGGPSPEGDMGAQLRAQVAESGLEKRVTFTGPMESEALKNLLSAADVFVLATRNEGWANVFLEAMACGLPVITTDVGGNAEVVCKPELGAIVPFGDQAALKQALSAALERKWERSKIIAYAEENAWDSRIAQLVEAFREIARHHSTERPAMPLRPQHKESETCR
ncbi:glycosyl transferase family 1 [Sulfurimicrobium lacus]|uniref:Glycosyl transferase family 1 n=1 Tax=Sulfurimicrobium lacus TaxID=2715678 RepID=A0A6F8VB82_9PROT|nr:glycosyltransferase [Sulfurimicrobium lacus]BCB26590.1 glycosyl transferase family 1 [Sulfurimicrobium lacus]